MDCLPFVRPLGAEGTGSAFGNNKRLRSGGCGGNQSREGDNGESNDRTHFFQLDWVRRGWFIEGDLLADWMNPRTACGCRL